MEQFLSWLNTECESYQGDEFKLRFRRFKNKQSQDDDAEESFLRDCCDIFDQQRDVLSPLLEWASSTSFQEYESAVSNNNSSNGSSELLDDGDVSSRILSDGKGKPLITTVKTYNLFIGDMPLEVTEEELKAAFSHFGTIKKCRIIQKGTKNLSFGFLHFTNPDNLHRALQEQPVVTFHGKKCRCGSSQERTTLYLSNIPPKATQRDVLVWLEKYVGKGTVSSVDVKCGPPPDFASRQFGFAQFVDQTTTELARRKFTNERPTLFDVVVNVAPADNMNNDEDALMGVKTMFLSNVAQDAQESDIRAACERYGSITKLNCVRRDRGFVYAEYSDRNNCLKAIEGLHNSKMGSQYMTAALAKPRTKDEGAGRGRGRGRGMGRGEGILPFGAAVGYKSERGGFARRVDSRAQPYDIRGRDRDRRDVRGGERDRDRKYGRGRGETTYRDWDAQSTYGAEGYGRGAYEYPYSAASTAGGNAYGSDVYAQYQAYYGQNYRQH